MRDLVSGAIGHMEMQGKRKPLRLLFVAAPLPGWGWSTLECEARDGLENVCATVSLKRWTQDGIAKRLRLEEKIDDSEAVLAVTRATGGWPVLLDRIFAMSDSPREMDLRKLVTPFAAWTSDKDNVRVVLRSTGLLDVPEVVRSVLLGIGREGAGLPASFVSGGYFDFPSEECAAALEYLRRYGFLDVRAGSDGESVVAEPVMLEILRAYAG